MRPQNTRPVLILILLLASVELMCFLALYVLDVRFGIRFQPVNQLPLAVAERISKSIDSNIQSLHEIDPRLGWTVRPDVVVGNYIINEDGVRSKTPVSSFIPIDRFRWGTFGDSFTFGDTVQNEHTWQSQIESSTPEWEFLNFGVGGYSIDQAYLRYQEQAQKFNFSAVIIGVQSRDIFEVVNTFRPFSLPKTSAPFSKPRYVIKEGQLHLLENPLPDRQSYQNLLSNPAETLDALGKHDHHYLRRYREGRFDFLRSVRTFKVLIDEIDSRLFHRGILRENEYDERSDAYAISDAILRSFYEHVERDQAIPVIVFYPNRRDIIRSRSGSDVSYAPLRDSLKKEGLRVVDPQEAFHTDDSVNDLVGGHYTALGNLRLAEYLSSTFSAIVR